MTKLFTSAKKWEVGDKLSNYSMDGVVKEVLKNGQIVVFFEETGEEIAFDVDELEGTETISVNTTSVNTTSVKSGIDEIMKFTKSDAGTNALIDKIEDNNGTFISAIYSEKGADALWQAQSQIDAHDHARKYKLAVTVPIKGGAYVLFYNTDKDLIKLSQVK